ncbi:MAG TPA: ABC transporter permease [Bacillota bacterium]|nr:ABC transporter permease [Bacillota bacterium]
MINKKEENVKIRNFSFQDSIRSFFKAQLIPLAVLLLIIIIASIASPAFLTFRNIQNLTVQISTTMIVGMGMLVVILTGGIDLSVGSIVAITGVIAAGFMEFMPVGMAIFMAILTGVLIGATNGFIVSKLRIAPFIVTLGMQSFARGCSYWYSKSQPIIWTPFPGADTMYQIGSGTFIAKIPYLAIIWVAIALITFILLNYTVLGRIVYSIGGNVEAVKLSGINVSKWLAVPYIFSGFCCGLAGVLLTSRLGVGAPTSGVGLELDAIAAVIVGGTSFNGGIGTVSGAIIGAFILSIIGNVLDLMGVSAYPQMMLKGTILIAAVILATIRDKSK